MTTTKTCPDCAGEQTCPGCAGQGWRYTVFNGRAVRLVCATCNGVGTCARCDGRGLLRRLFDDLYAA